MVESIRACRQKEHATAQVTNTNMDGVEQANGRTPNKEEAKAASNESPSKSSQVAPVTPACPSSSTDRARDGLAATP